MRRRVHQALMRLLHAARIPKRFLQLDPDAACSLRPAVAPGRARRQTDAKAVAARPSPPHAPARPASTRHPSAVALILPAPAPGSPDRIVRARPGRHKAMNHWGRAAAPRPHSTPSQAATCGSFTGAAPPIRNTASQAVGTRNMFCLTYVQDPGGSRFGGPTLQLCFCDHTL